jgi:hypothetical protein
MSYFYLIQEKPVESTHEIPGATEISQEVFLEMLPKSADWDGFRQWRRQNEDYVALTRAEGGLTLAMEADIARGDYAAAAEGWDRLKGLGAVSAGLEAALMGAIQIYNLTSLAQALAAHNQGQP